MPLISIKSTPPVVATNFKNRDHYYASLKADFFSNNGFANNDELKNITNNEMSGPTLLLNTINAPQATNKQDLIKMK